VGIKISSGETGRKSPINTQKWTHSHKYFMSVHTHKHLIAIIFLSVKRRGALIAAAATEIFGFSLLKRH